MPIIKIPIRARLHVLFWLTVIAATVQPSSAQTNHVRPIRWSDFAGQSAIKEGNLFGQKLVQLMQLHARYVLAEIDRDYKVYRDLPEFADVEYYYPFERPGATEHSIRPLGDLTYGIAVMLKTGTYSPEIAKVSRSEALRRAELSIRGIAFTHRANRKSGRSWGGRCSNNTCWQAAYWASLAGQAAWMLWDDLSDDTQVAVGRMIEYEADSFTDYKVPYRWNLAGKDLSPGNTRSEENAWNARLLIVAQGMMPAHPNVGSWRKKASELLISAYSRPSDKSNDTMVDGKPVREWVRGANMAEDGVNVNHRMIQPDYTACDAELRGAAVLVASLAKQQIPESAFFNARIVYSALTEIDFKPGPSPYGDGKILEPGGTIYKRTRHGEKTKYSAQVFYPQGADWVRDDVPIVMAPHLNMDLYAEVFGFDADKDFDSIGWAQARVDRLLEMQARSGEEGKVYQPGDWVADYYSNEQVIFETNAEALLLWWLQRQGKIAPIAPGWADAPRESAGAADRIEAIVSLEEPAAERVAFWETVLPERPLGVGPTISDRAAWEKIGELPEYSALIQRAAALKDQPFPHIPDGLYLEYSRTGRRESCQRRIGERMEIFTTLVYAECIENEGRFLPAIEAALKSYGDLKTWLYPAHDPELANFYGRQTDINICSSAVGWNVATAAWWLGERLNPQVRRMVAENLERRIFAPYEELVKTGRPRRKWVLNTANHNSVTSAGVTGAAMAQIASRERRAFFAAANEKFIKNYLWGFTPDGFCAEGVGYWSYGFGRYFMLAETLHRSSGGKVDWLSDPHVRAIAEFGHRTEIQAGVFPTYSDCSPREQPDVELIQALAEKFDWKLHPWEVDRLEKIRRPRRDLFTFALFDCDEAGRLNARKATSTEPLPLRDYFPDGGLLICRPHSQNGDGLAVSIKGGHNAEPHNHNDLGSFTVVYKGEALVVDPGAEVYTSRTFSPRRYESDVLNSLGHSVPRIAGELQRPGARAASRIVRTSFTDDQDVLQMDLSAAYDAAGLRRLDRTFSYGREGEGVFEVTDDFESSRPKSMETAIITFANWRLETPRRIRIGEGATSLAVDISANSEFRVRADDIEAELRGSERPKRIAVELTKPAAEGRVVLTFRPWSAKPSKLSQASLSAY